MPDIITKSRKVINLKQLGIKNIETLGIVELLSFSDRLSEHMHENCFEICYHYDGVQYYEIQGDNGYTTQSGDIFITMPNEQHGTGNQNEQKSKFYYIIFNCMPDTKDFLGLDEPASSYIRDTLFSIKTRLFKSNSAIKTILSQIISCYFSNSPLKTARINGLLVEFFYQLTELIIKNDIDIKAIPKDIELAEIYMNEHVYDDYTLEWLAKEVDLSYSRFKRKFKEHTGLTPHDYRLRKKVNIAQLMLKQAKSSITDIAYELGFSSSQHFSTAFKKYTGKTPRQYKQSEELKNNADL